MDVTSSRVGTACEPQPCLSNDLRLAHSSRNRAARQGLSSRPGLGAVSSVDFHDAEKRPECICSSALVSLRSSDHEMTRFSEMICRHAPDLFLNAVRDINNQSMRTKSGRLLTLAALNNSSPQQ